MNLKVKNINKRINELDTEIQRLEQRLAATIWERKKFLEYSDNKNSKKRNNKISMFSYVKIVNC